MKNETYNGWTNWDTWNLALWIDNTEDTYHKGRVMAGEPDRFARWAETMCLEINQQHKEEINWDRVNVDEIREALLCE